MSAPGKVWRVGQHYGIHVYEGETPIATFVGPREFAEANARAVVEDHNAKGEAKPVEPQWSDDMGDYYLGKGRPLFTSPPSQIAKVRALRARYVFAALDSVYSESLSAKVEAADEIIKLLEDK